MDSKEHRRQLLEILKQISSGEIDIDNVPLDKLFTSYMHAKSPNAGPRREYISPEDRNSYNYGYMTLPEVTIN